MDSLSIGEALVKFIKTKPEMVHIGEVRANNNHLIDVIAMNTGHHISMEMHRKIRKKAREKMLQEAFKDKDIETIKLIEAVKKLEVDLEEYSYMK